MSARRLAAAAVLLAAACMPALAHEVRHGELAIAHPFLAADPACPGPVTRGYLMLVVNQGRQADRLLGLELPGGKSARMLRRGAGADDPPSEVRDGLEVPAGGRLALMAPQYAFELPIASASLTEGSMVPATLRFARAGAVPVQFMVEASHRGADGSAPCGAPAKTRHKH